MLSQKLTVEEDFKLISEELMKTFNIHYLDELGRKELFLKRTKKLRPIDFISLCGFLTITLGPIP